MLSTPWNQRKTSYDIVVIGSGYGGAITAARLASAPLTPKPSVCILERGKEWSPGDFPENLAGVIANSRNEINPLGLYELLPHADISVVKGSGLGGTSLINANVAITPDEEVFEKFGWPKSITHRELKDHYATALATLAAGPHPRAQQLAKVVALKRRGAELGIPTEALNIAVNFTIDGKNPHGVDQKPCNDCGNCVSGCNVKAKNTLAMNYLPMAKNAGATILTQTQVERIEKRPGGGWRVIGKHINNVVDTEDFVIEARDVVLAAGSLNSTEILLRSEQRGLPVSPALGTRFNGNGDFFGLAYNGDFETDVLGYAYKAKPKSSNAPAPGPNIVGALRYNANGPMADRITIEDFSFPNAYVREAQAMFAAIRGQDMVIGNEDAQRKQVNRDLNPFDSVYRKDGALNHTMLYLVMGMDNARGTMSLDVFNQLRISWDQVGQQQVFTRMNDEIRRHARALRGNFISNPTWAMFNARHLITAHPLGGCPMGDDHLQGAVDPFGRVYSNDGSVHDGLYVTDGSILPSALAVNPFLTISALAERFAARKVRQLQGEAYPAPAPRVSMSGLSAIDVTTWNESQLEALFRRTETLPIERLVNSGADAQISTDKRTIFNDKYWKGFFPKQHVLNTMSSAIFTGFKKAFSKDGANFAGLTTDTDGRIRARNSLEQFELKTATGTLEAGKYIILRYLDPPWQSFYDIFKIVNDDLLIGRVYLGQFPNGVRMFTFPMTRRYSFNQMTVADHQALYKSAPAPTAAQMEGVWRMDAVTNNNHSGGVAYLGFTNKPDGRLEARYRLMGLIEGLVVPTVMQDHFQLNDFTPFHDEIRFLAPDLLIGRYTMAAPPPLASNTQNSLGLLQLEPDGQLSVYYLLTKTEKPEMPGSTLLEPFLNAQLPDGVGLTFDEEMDGFYFAGQGTLLAGREGDLKIASRIPADGSVPNNSCAASFKVRMVIDDVNSFVDGIEHEARLRGSITFARWENSGPATFTIDESLSRFHYLRVNDVTKEAEMRYHLEFANNAGRKFIFEGIKYMQKDMRAGIDTMRELLLDYTTLYCHLYEKLPAGARPELGTAYLKFRTFENIAATGSLAAFLGSFTVTGTNDPLVQLQARARFIGFTGQFVQMEYDPASFGPSQFAGEVREAVRRGAETPDFFSTKTSEEIAAILRDTPTLPLEKLLNHGGSRIDLAQGRVFRDSFWKGTFAKDSLIGAEERLRNTIFGNANPTAGIFTGGSFWKRFDSITAGVAKGFVVNYELAALPGLPEVRMVNYPDDNRPYFRKGDPILLLSYTNNPYKMVYDTIKVIDEHNCLGVMHVGNFPNGIEVAKFIMARHNYPFQNMSVEDHESLFAGASPQPAIAQATGKWAGRLVTLRTPDTSLNNQFSPVVFNAEFTADPANPALLQADWSIAGAPTQEHNCPPGDLRLLNPTTLIGRWTLPGTSQPMRFVLTKAI